MITNSEIAVLNYNSERKLEVQATCRCFFQETFAEKASNRNASGFDEDAFSHCFIPSTEIERDQLKRNSIIIRLEENKPINFEKVSGLSELADFNYFKVKEAHLNTFGSVSMHHYEVILDV